MKVLAIACVVAGLATVAGAQPPPACSGDVGKFCKEIAPGGGRIVACLKAHEPDLSPACKQALAEARAALTRNRGALATMLSACQGDRQTYCKDVAAGGGRIIACLKQNEAKLSAPCKKAVDGAAQPK